MDKPKARLCPVCNVSFTNKRNNFYCSYKCEKLNELLKHQQIRLLQDKHGLQSENWLYVWFPEQRLWIQQPKEMAYENLQNGKVVYDLDNNQFLECD